MGNPNLPPELILAIGRGEKEALERLYQDWKGKIFHFAYFKTEDPEAAQEILQEVFLGIWKNARFYRKEAAPLTWIFALVKRKVADYYREKAKEKRVFNNCKDEKWEMNETDNMPDFFDFFKALEELEPKTREAIICVYYLGFNYEETADHLGIPPGTIKSKLFYGKKKLKEKLGKGRD